MKEQIYQPGELIFSKDDTDGNILFVFFGSVDLYLTPN